ncbi:calmin isoform X2 [Tiliqua scincoides]
MALLEVLSGQNLLHEYKSSTHRIFRLNNIAKALKFLEDSNVKLVSIDAAEIADGNSSMVLGLIWNIILFFQIKELTGNLNRNSSSSSLSSGPSGPDSDTSHPSTPNVERSMSVSVKDQRKAIRALLTWVQRKTRKYGVAVQDFASSWRSGLAFLATIKAIDSSLVDMKQALEKSPRENLEDAFTIAQDYLGIPRLLEPEDIMVESPDEQSIMTYVAQFLEHFPELEGEDFSDPDKESPGETMYVHVKDPPEEGKEDKIFILNENGEHTYLDRNQLPPLKIHTVGSPLDHKDINLHLGNEGLYDNQHQPLSDHSEIFTGEHQRSHSLPISEPFGFQASSVTDILANEVNKPKGNEQSMSDSVTQNDNLPPTFPVYRIHSIDPIDSSGVESEELNMQKPTSETQESVERKSGSLPRTSQAPQNVSEHQTEETRSPVSGSEEEEMAHKYVAQMLHDEVSKLPENNDSEEQSSDLKEVDSAHPEISGSNFSSSSETSCPPECLSLPVRNTPKSLDITNEERMTAEKSLNSPKVSVIPHDLFYYPHYDVPISEVLDAFAAPDPDPSLSENHKICAELLVNCLAENESLTLSSEDGVPEPGRGTEEEVMPKEMDDKSLGKRKKDPCRQTKSSLNNRGATVVPRSVTPALSTQKDSTHADVPMIMVNQFDIVATEEKKPPEERSKRKEKRKNKIVYQGENTQSSKAGCTRLLEKLEEESIDHQGFSRVSQSEPNVFQRNTSEPIRKESGTMDEQKSTTSCESPTSSVRKRKELEKKEAPERVISHTNTSRTDQPELFYFIVFLWVLVYCLLLLPQLISS